MITEYSVDGGVVELQVSDNVDTVAIRTQSCGDATLNEATGEFEFLAENKFDVSGGSLSIDTAAIKDPRETAFVLHFVNKDGSEAAQWFTFTGGFHLLLTADSIETANKRREFTHVNQPTSICVWSAE